jgi:hypothetical protein
MSGVIVLETAMEAFVPHASIAVAIAWKLRERFGDISGGLVGIFCDSDEPIRRKSRL